MIGWKLCRSAMLLSRLTFSSLGPRTDRPVVMRDVCQVRRSPPRREEARAEIPPVRLQIFPALDLNHRVPERKRDGIGGTGVFAERDSVRAKTNVRPIRVQVGAEL